ncbi:hypothetical protein AJ80_05378 [Polytolypa hystricis UAMH7299]|uniref:Endo-1,4-beta-xylanase n=1 Tax=Polytolypa hystricis (strain UAMH7299) TaxID=1447883 RepID=A0A2B7Y5B0_POLH7|nr:hypothetical protein AJ80_05378 [Polytolypa hystricis UAMH7299]
MIALKSLLVALSTISGALAATAEPELAVRQGPSTPTGSGNHEGFYYYFWNDGSGSVNYANEDGGQYSVQWKDSNSFTAGKGYENPGLRNITYSGSYTPGPRDHLTIYGHTQIRNPIVEFYIIEDYKYLLGNVGPKQGSVTTDGGTYDIYTSSYQSGIPEGANLQVYSVRREKRVGGTVNLANHWDAWNSLGLRIEYPRYAIVAVEGWSSSAGSATIKVE